MIKDGACKKIQSDISCNNNKKVLTNLISAATK